MEETSKKLEFQTICLSLCKIREINKANPSVWEQKILENGKRRQDRGVGEYNYTEGPLDFLRTNVVQIHPAIKENEQASTSDLAKMLKTSCHSRREVEPLGCGTPSGRALPTAVSRS